MPMDASTLPLASDKCKRFHCLFFGQDSPAFGDANGSIVNKFLFYMAARVGGRYYLYHQVRCFCHELVGYAVTSGSYEQQVRLTHTQGFVLYEGVRGSE